MRVRVPSCPIRLAQAVKEARLKEIKQEILHSRKLTEHFDANPDDLKASSLPCLAALSNLRPLNGPPEF